MLNREDNITIDETDGSVVFRDPAMEKAVADIAGWLPGVSRSAFKVIYFKQVNSNITAEDPDEGETVQVLDQIMSRLDHLFIRALWDVAINRYKDERQAVLFLHGLFFKLFHRQPGNDEHYLRYLKMPFKPARAYTDNKQEGDVVWEFCKELLPIAGKNEKSLDADSISLRILYVNLQRIAWDMVKRA